jgi:hypothetical protein
MSAYITKIETVDSGDGCFVDLIHLPDGRVIGVSEDCAVLYASRDDFFEPPEEINGFQTIWLGYSDDIYL